MKTQMKTTAEIMEEYDILHHVPQDITDSITHQEFVAGVRDKTVGFAMNGGEPSTLVRGGRKVAFNVLVMLYFLAPVLMIPVWAYHESKWWLLIGIPVSSIIAPQLQAFKKSIGGLLLFATAVFWFFGGIHNYLTFFSLCGLWGAMFFQMAEEAQIEYAMQSLIESPELFKDAVIKQRIRVLRKR
jgi:hypothetical protein